MYYFKKISKHFNFVYEFINSFKKLNYKNDNITAKNKKIDIKIIANTLNEDFKKKNNPSYRIKLMLATELNLSIDDINAYFIYKNKNKK